MSFVLQTWCGLLAPLCYSLDTVAGADFSHAGALWWWNNFAEIKGGWAMQGLSTQTKFSLRFEREQTLKILMWFVSGGAFKWVCLTLTQNRRQKVVNRGLCVCAGGFTFMQGGLTFKFDQIPLIYSVSCFNLVGLELYLGGNSPPKPPRGDGTALTLSIWVKIFKQENYVLQY